jgi:hypothetical protein
MDNSPWEAEVEEYHQQSQKSQGINFLDEDDAFVCANCGKNDEWYADASGMKCCSNCHTESQMMTAESAEFDQEAIYGLAGRTKQGNMLTRTVSKKRSASAADDSSQKDRKKRTFEQYDKSVPFPDLPTCLNGMQKVMKHCIVCLCDLAGLNDTEQRNAVMETVRTLWMSYLKAWADGAEFYGKMHPEIRFSMRDCFLTTTHRTLILRHLSYKLGNEVRAEVDAESSDSDNDSEDDQWRNIPPEVLPHLSKGYMKVVDRSIKQYHLLSSLMMAYWDRGDRGRLECALVLKPSMRLIVCLLWMATSRAGVTAEQVLNWIANGAIPLQNAFRHCFNEEDRIALKLVAGAFCLKTLPSAHEIESLACKIAVACSFTSFSPPQEKSKQDESPGGEKAELKQTKRKRKRTRLEARPDFCFVTPESVPLMTARLIRDLGFGKRVFDYALALMGFETTAPPQSWLPAPLEQARPENLWSQAHVLAVIVVACKMVPGWETRPYPTDRAGKTPLLSEDSGFAKTSERQKTLAPRDRFVPYNDQHIRFLENGPSLEGYVDFVEENIFTEEASDGPIFPEFTARLKADKPKTDAVEQDSHDDTTAAVLPNPILFGARNPNQPRKMWRKQKYHSWNLSLENSRAKWSDANALNEYVVYTDRQSHALVTQHIQEGHRNSSIRLTPEPFHPHYATLIEYMSYKTSVKPSKIHCVVSKLDEEVLEHAKKLERPGRRKKEKRPTTVKKETPIEDTSDASAAVPSPTGSPIQKRFRSEVGESVAV